MIAAMLIVIMLQVRSFSTMTMVMLTAPLGLVGVVPMLLTFNQPFGFNAILGLIGLAGILMRNTLILTEQIKENRAAGLDDYHAVIEATVQRTRPVILTALAAVLAFIPLTHSVFWGSMAYTLIGGTAVGTVLILLFLPALYAAWFRIKPTADDVHEASTEEPELRQQWLPNRALLSEETVQVLAEGHTFNTTAQDCMRRWPKQRSGPCAGRDGEALLAPRERSKGVPTPTSSHIL